MRYLIALGLCALTSFAAPPSLSADVSFNVGVTSDYVFRGISQTSENPALQAGFDYSHGTGFYVGVWGSNVDFGTAADIEVDAFIGFSRTLGNGLIWDIGLVHYDYPGESEINFEEIYAGISYRVFNLRYSFSDDFAGTGGRETYLELGLELALPRGFGLSLHAGRTELGDEVGFEDYTDYRISVSKQIRGFDLELGFVDTDTDAFGELGDDRFVFSISREF